MDKLVDVAKRNGSKNVVETSLDWKTIEFMYKGFKILYPMSARDFENSMNFFRTSEQFNKGMSKEGSALIQHLVEVPAPLYHMVKVIFPLQPWDRKFITALGNHLPQLKAHV